MVVILIAQEKKPASVVYVIFDIDYKFVNLGKSDFYNDLTSQVVFEEFWYSQIRYV